MNFTAPGLAASVLPESFYLIGWLGLAFLAWRWLMSGDWRRLAEPSKLNLFLAATVAVLALWQIRTGIQPGLAFHLYGIAALTLMFGFWRATFAGVLILLANAAFGRSSWNALGVDALLVAALPAAVSWSVYRVLEWKLPNHFFVYVLGNGFFGAALSVAAIGLATTALMSVAGVYSLDYLLTHYTPYATLLISWAEAFSTGMAITVMAVYRPAWLETFDDAKYIQNK
ncbi:MAG: energy-coupling factor ABC transporter permease [Thiobacillus sp.]|uniref:energy-coupling factor ABC transporter permease n=1 Tax=Thiobacillus sp. TaxID=924 RepID=UPI0027361D1F|nr:energy-coupling factor ABC transporter permease [Thiobacillus sp.]MDP3419965.1 energy-coupling factor ABC transporter permease [Thiobacillus sp.]MDP3586224.1 energy-coupling factor ABC transporter permease [Thiobacillus sp.]